MRASVADGRGSVEDEACTTLHPLLRFLHDAMSEFPKGIYTEPQDIDVDTLGNLGPLRTIAGVWQGVRGLDLKPKADGPKKQARVEPASSGRCAPPATATHEDAASRSAAARPTMPGSKKAWHRPGA
jgi:hypothetical protein